MSMASTEIKFGIRKKYHGINAISLFELNRYSSSRTKHVCSFSECEEMCFFFQTDWLGAKED